MSLKQTTGALVGIAIGASVGGPLGAWIGGVIGGNLMRDKNKTDGDIISQSNSSTYSVEPPNKIIIFIGVTGVGKSSTINSILENNVCSTGVEHGTTTIVKDINYKHGYSLRDTPGLEDSKTDFSTTVWKKLRDSELVIYTATGQLYRQEIEWISRIRSSQKEWDRQSGCYNRRKIAIYVNKIDKKESSMTSADRIREIEKIKEQVSPWISPDRIISGASSPYVNGKKVDPRIDRLRQFILNHTQPY